MTRMLLFFNLMNKLPIKVLLLTHLEEYLY